jgi:surface protein
MVIQPRHRILRRVKCNGHELYVFCATAFNQEIGSWDMSSVTDMSFMKYGVMVFNQNIGSWDVSKLTNMSRMCCHAHVFNHNIERWDVSNATKMEGMFYGATAFNQDIGSWDLSSVTEMIFTCLRCRCLRPKYLIFGDVSKETNTTTTFAHLNWTKSLDLGIRPT